jgi:hypothetical protein
MQLNFGVYCALQRHVTSRRPQILKLSHSVSVPVERHLWFRVLLTRPPRSPVVRALRCKPALLNARSRLVTVTVAPAGHTLLRRFQCAAAAPFALSPVTPCSALWRLVHPLHEAVLGCR